MSQPAPEAPARPAGGGSGTILPLVILGVGGYLAWFGVKYWRSQTVAWPSDPIKAILQGKPLPSTTAAATASAQLSAFETALIAAGQAPNPVRGGAGGQGSPTPSGPPPPPNASQTLIIRAILAGLGAPQTTANINSMAAWQRHEAPWNASPPDGAELTHNPWNTTLAAGSVGTVPGTPGVRIYPNWGVGVAATVATLQGYPGIVGALRSGRGICGGSLAADFCKWSDCAHGGYSSVC